MPPKFQSTFIPRGPTAHASVSSSVIPRVATKEQTDFFGFLVKAIFALSILVAVGVVGYKWYLNYSIKEMSVELEAARQEVATGVTGELIRLNDRIVSTQSLIEGHRVLSPFFLFLQSSTPKSVRFNDFRFAEGESGPELLISGQAQSYAALAFQANVINNNKDLKNPIFSDIRLDEKGNVSFSFKAGVSPELVSYANTIGRTGTSTQPNPAVILNALLPTSTPRVATGTPQTIPNPR